VEHPGTPVETFLLQRSCKRERAKAAVEEDPQRLFELVQQINRIFEEQDTEQKRPTDVKTQ
jgi:hypothetical protein